MRRQEQSGCGNKSIRRAEAAALNLVGLTTAEVTSDTYSKQIVNWDIAKERLHETSASIETGWNRLKSSFRSL